jgi:prepilin-type N-terminal cleavage/methylation domain-containing protein/prepilin-type processing-associated H-X9-DG protein
MPAWNAGSRRAFTLVELLVVIGIIATLIAVLLPTLGKARASAARAQCLSNIRQLQIAQLAYAAANKNTLISADDGQGHGAWIELLEPYAGGALVRRCPSDQSVYFETALPNTTPPRLRTTSYGINNLLSIAHNPNPLPLRPRLITQVRRSSQIIQFAELAETGSYAGSDHVHVQDLYQNGLPQLTLAKIDQQMPTGRHGGRRRTWNALLNFSFLDGHAETLSIQQAYVDPTTNLFDPLLGK